ncbi:P-loop containing nucleoside triphosphate hydrolase protein [Basidiobolus meristosporus CBS 931.73]|uniref:p-loop containing nucleoside triphosphate hydrolase protein n=1 Tax=Basidiobolus meristosporus CBS 931.73 TaxID=1314790 RepID=A0A1Y1YSQ2_9FUNG|nr:P-loop containing nucleoside triphosphate hydrolase protein [Basidiobolus meristosporus CBS 931.73]|eukprot:ORY00989.1 P-loop containing nucleoside triphosphate hydrolase protein [Basidiobolus meristosporus CBS 931.73]
MSSKKEKRKSPLVETEMAMVHHSYGEDNSTSQLFDKDAMDSIWSPFTSLFTGDQISIILMAWLPSQIESITTNIVAVDMFIISALVAGIVAMMKFSSHVSLSALNFKRKKKAESISIQVEPEFMGLYDEMEANPHHKSLSWLVSEQSKNLMKGNFLMIPETETYRGEEDDDDVHVPEFNVLPQDNENLFISFKGDVFKVFFKENSDQDNQQKDDNHNRNILEDSSKIKRKVKALPSIVVELCPNFVHPNGIQSSVLSKTISEKGKPADDPDVAMDKVIRFIQATTRAHLIEQKDDRVRSRYERGAYGWESIQTLTLSRGLDTVCLDKSNEDLLKHDLETFLADKEFYQRIGLPYRRGILLYGNPGTGKTSLVNAISSQLNRDLYFINLKEIENDAGLNSAFNSVPANQIIVLEDCDTQSRVLHARKHASSKDELMRMLGPNLDSSTKLGSGEGFFKPFTLSTFLANLDGHSLSEGNIIIMTTNHPELLDPAVIRPGRMDLKIELGYCTHYQIQRMYASVLEDPKAKLDEEILKEKVPERLLPPCEVMTCMVLYRRTPEVILDKILELVKKFQGGAKSVIEEEMEHRAREELENKLLEEIKARQENGGDEGCDNPTEDQSQESEQTQPDEPAADDAPGAESIDKPKDKSPDDSDYGSDTERAAV